MFQLSAASCSHYKVAHVPTIIGHHAAPHPEKTQQTTNIISMDEFNAANNVGTSC